MRVLGFSNGHDKGAVIIENGEVKVGITQERLSRIKHDGAYSGGIVPWESINYCLDALGITYKDIDLFVYSTTEQVDDVANQFRKVTNNSQKLLFIPHHLAHAYSSFFSSGFDDAAVLVCDASGSILNYQNKLHHWYDGEKLGLNKSEDWTESISIYHFNRKSYEEVYKKWMPYPVPFDTDHDVSLGTRYSDGTLQLVYEPVSNSWSAGKLMGLASYADQEFLNSVPNFTEIKDGDIYIPNYRIYPRVTWQSDFQSRARVAGLYQREQENASLWLAEKAKDLTGSKNICVAGGSFLNCNSNEKILKSGLYEKCFFIPPSDDSGIPLGCAWYAYQQVANITNKEFISPYFGKTYSRNEILSALNEFPEVVFEEHDDFETVIQEISWALSENRVIGWFQDGSEIGPRALGNRSILASPTQSWMTGHINGDIKKREWYRPFAPAVLFEHQRHVFESDIYSPYMLVTTTVKEEWRNKIPAVTHIDNSARHQSVTEKNNLKFYKLISSFYNKTGVPVLLNTSFNGPHEPIVETPKEAIRTFLERGIDFLVINNFIISRTKFGE